MRARAALILTLLGGCTPAPAKLVDPPLELRGRPTTFASDMPCDTCPLFQFVINLYPDSTYQWRKWANNPPGYPDLSRADRGRWRLSPAGDLLKLEGDEEGSQALAILSSQLLETRAPDGAPTTWALSYALKRQKQLDQFRVPYEIVGQIDFDQEKPTFIDCHSHKTSIIARSPRLAELNNIYRQQHLPKGRRFFVYTSGYLKPLRPVAEVRDTLFLAPDGGIGFGGEISWSGGCGDPYPRFQLGGATWGLYELLGRQIDPSTNPGSLVVDTLERVITISTTCARIVGHFNVGRIPEPPFRAVDVQVTRPACTPSEEELVGSIVNALHKVLRFGIRADILLLTGLDIVAARFVATGRR